MRMRGVVGARAGSNNCLQSLSTAQVEWFGFRTPLMRAVLDDASAGRVEPIPKDWWVKMNGGWINMAEGGVTAGRFGESELLMVKNG